MFIGHFAFGFASKRWAPAVSLGALFAACQLADLLWPTLVLLGVEKVRIEPGATAMTPLDFVSYPFSHGLVSLCVWGALFGVTYVQLRRAPVRAGVVIGALVVSHWVLDFVSHRPDMPILFAGPRVGLGLWNSVPATVAVESAMFVAGVVTYLFTTEARDRVGTFALWGLIVFLAAVYALNVSSPPPPSASAVAWAAQAIWLLVAWGYWVDRHRRPRGRAVPA